MNTNDKISTGMKGFDQAIDMLRPGDNVVWQVDAVCDYRKIVEPYAVRARLDQRKLVYVRFGSRAPLLKDSPEIKTYHLDAKKGFENFATAVHSLVEQEGRETFYVFDCLSDLLAYWYSDLMISNFFKVACPFLHELDTVAYFAVKRNVHTCGTIACIRETTQLLLDLYQVKDKFYIHPLKVWQRYSPTMFFPHLIQDQEIVCITSGSGTAELFSGINRGEERLDYWDVVVNRAKAALTLGPEKQEKAKRLLMTLVIGSKSGMFELCDRYFTLKDIINIAAREVGSGFIGGKSVGMLLARKILERESHDRFTSYLEPHDSYYLGSDVFYTYIVQNGCWKLRIKQKTKKGYFKYAPELKEKILNGKFSELMREKFMLMLEHFGQSPIIVRSSSLLEDNFGNTFAGKYESVFCVNQGTLEERYTDFEQAIRTVYASTMNEDALAYRMTRGLFDEDEQMAILVQRVSGDYHKEKFFPHVAGVGNSSNLYVWDKSMDMNAGMLRLVFGLGTKAVERTSGDYAKIVCLDNPLRIPPINRRDKKKFSQHYVDVLSLKENTLASQSWEEIVDDDFKADKNLFASRDQRTANRLRELGYTSNHLADILDFHKLLKDTEFPGLMQDMLAILSGVYNYPVDIEFTVNFTPDNHFKVNLLQCRPLRTKGLGNAVQMPEPADERDFFLSTRGNFMGGNLRLPVDFIVYVDAQAYAERNERDKCAVARQIGLLNKALKGKNVMLVGPGRWGTTTPSLGVPVHFTELCNMSVICEVASCKAGFTPELSFGTHFFQNLVESDIFYVAIFDGQKDVVFHPEHILKRENMLAGLFPQCSQFTDVIHVAQTDGLVLFSDILTQKLLCKYSSEYKTLPLLQTGALN
ncbi:PEP/pyruvate-binding domain-containing protein [Desulfoscipio sp. XC116]|uniref:PEP/pyruvate-binding domain-containing protein n=1 Tax=Desulfoscipio sp. XC116 TaxID=3144975 RepID=UPI00325A8FB7